jgi:hypothetical protein
MATTLSNGNGKSRPARKARREDPVKRKAAKRKPGEEGYKAGKPKGWVNPNPTTPETRTREAPICGAKRTGKSTSGPGICCQVAGWGTSHVGIGRCRLHGGNTPNQMQAAEKDRQIIAAKNAVELYGLPVDIDPHESLAREVRRTAGHVEWLGSFIQDLGSPEKLKQVTEMGVQPSVWISMYQAERKHLVDVNKAAIAAGVSERKMQLQEEQGRLIAMAFQIFIRDEMMAFTPTQMVEAPKALRRALEGVPNDFVIEDIPEAELVDA